MKYKIMTLCSALLVTPLLAIASSDFDSAVKDATAEIDKAKMANNEWRDSRNLLEEAQKAEKAGDHDKAMQLVAKAKEQGTLAIAQAKQQAKAGPH